MKVFLFRDHLASINGAELSDEKKICEIENLNDMPDSPILLNGKLASVCAMNKQESRVYIKYLAKFPKEEEVSFSQNITCPHCGHENRDSWEAIDESEEEECGQCGSVFSYVRNIEVTYSSEIIKRNEEVIEVKLRGES